MDRVEKNEEREHRIYEDAIVDAYDPEEQAMGWYYYLDDRIRFPFEVRCATERTLSPLHDREEVEVIGMADMEDCERDMFVAIKWMDREMGVPLAQLAPVGVDEDTEEAIGDWHYWMNRGYQLR